MGLTMQEMSIGQFRVALKSLSAILTKAEEHAKANSIPASELTTARIHADMLPLPSQVNFVTDISRKTAWRLTGSHGELAPWATELNDNSDFAALQARITEAAEYLDKALAGDASTFIAEDHLVDMVLGPLGTIPTPAKAYINSFGIPNVFFHVTTTYNILRMKGVPLGKGDFLGPFLNLPAKAE